MAILIGGIAIGWASYELGAKSRMINCLVADLGVRVKENLESLLRVLRDVSGSP